MHVVPCGRSAQAASRTRAYAAFGLLAVLGVLGASPAAAAPPAESSDVLRERARQASMKDDRQGAILALERARELDPDAPEVLVDLARLRAAGGDVDGAVECYQRRLALVPEDDDVLRAMGMTLSWGKERRHLTVAEQTLSTYLARHPRDDAARLQRARVRSWLGAFAASSEDYRTYLARRPNDEDMWLELGRALSWSKERSDLRAAIAVLGRYLKRHPDSNEALLQRARARAWSGDHARAIADFRAYLVRSPSDGATRLELARELSATKDRTSLLEALRIYDRHLAAHASDLEALLARGRVRLWAGMPREAADDLGRVSRARPADDALKLEIADAVAQGPSPADAVFLYDEFLGAHRGHLVARTHRARALSWAGRVWEAENALLALRREPLGPSLANAVDLQLARVYAQTERGYDAMDAVEGVLLREPDHAEARAEKTRLSPLVGSSVEPRFFSYGDKSGILVAAAEARGRASLHRNLAVLVDAGGWSLGTRAETLRAGRANAGAWLRLKPFELEAAAGPRVYEIYSPRVGGRASARVVSRAARVDLDYHYDDIYFDLYQPASVTAGIRGHALYLTGRGKLPFGIEAVGRAGSRALEPDNRSFDTTGRVLVPVVRPLSVGYTGQYLTWRYHDPAYWSPQAFVSHLGIVRVAQTFGRAGFAYDVQGVFGIAGERVDRVPDSGYGPSFGGSAAIEYAPSNHLVLRATTQYAQTVRELQRPPATGDTGLGGAAAAARPAGGAEPSRYWWLTGMVSALVRM